VRHIVVRYPDVVRYPNGNEGCLRITTQVQEILHSIERLGDEDNRELVAKLLRPSTAIDDRPLSDEQLLGATASPPPQQDFEASAATCRTR
jgi:hypothetical protein